MGEMTGGCLCGQVRYSANAEPAFVGVCHCKHCQKQTGSAFSVIACHSAWGPNAGLRGNSLTCQRKDGSNSETDSHSTSVRWQQSVSSRPSGQGEARNDVCAKPLRFGDHPLVLRPFDDQRETIERVFQ
jgi:hypothetical protein